MGFPRSRFTLVLWLFWPLVASSTTVQEMAIDTMLQQAELVFEGEVIQVESQQDPAGWIATYVTFRVLDVIKGDTTLDALELRFMGGTVDGRTTAVSGLQIPAAGEWGVYFVESLSDDLVNPLLGWSQGHFLVVSDDQGSARITTADHREILDIQPHDQVPALIRRPLTVVDGEGDTAAGVILRDPETPGSPALSVGQFKQRLRQLAESNP